MKTNKKILSLILSAALISPGLAFAQGLTCPAGVNIPSMVCNAVNTALVIASGVVIIMWVITGILFLSAQGAPEKLTTARKSLIYSVVGTVLVIVATFGMDLVGQAFGI